MYKVLVTGASRGIGKAICNKYREAGYDVLALDSSIVDLRETSGVIRYMDSLEDKPVIIINNAGINPINTVEKIELDQVQSVFNVTVFSTLEIIKACVSRMREVGFGRIVNISSIWSVVSKPGRLTYSSAKHALDGITTTLALELARDGVLVNTVCPGFTETELTRQNNTQAEIEQMCNSVPLGRLAQPEEIAGLVYYLGSPDNSFITGQRVVIDGGFTIQ